MVGEGPSDRGMDMRTELHSRIKEDRMNNAKLTNENHTQSNDSMYRESYEACRKKFDQLTTVSDRISFLRGITFTAAGLFLFIGYQQKNPVLLMPVAGLGFLFLVFIFYHHKLEEELERLKDSQSVLKEYMARFDDGWKRFPIDGERYLSDNFSEAADLDLFGKNSLYQYICTASTIRGQDQLALWLSLSGRDCPAEDAAQISHKINRRQQAVAELAGKTEFCMELETCARPFRSVAYDKAAQIMEQFFDELEKEHHFPMICRILIRLFPILTLAFLFSALLGVYRPLTMSLFFFFALGQLMSAFLGFHRNNQALSPIYQMNRTIAPYRKLFQLLEKEPFESPYLNDLQNTLLKNKTASAALEELESIADSVCTRHNVYAFLICNSLFLHDYHCMERYEKWKENYKDSLRPWLNALGKAEALISLSVICHTRKIHCLPEIEDSGHPVFTASNIRHPLLKESSAVGNDIRLRHRTCIITGSNMSGKTTFMRSIGINFALACAGGFCTASDLHTSPMKLCTSIRTEDDVGEGISTFYAELLRIKQMIETSRKQIPMISLIDEIYKGTNSGDRIFAAKETIKNLSKPCAFTLVTTHDFELCDLENDPDIDAINYHFTEYYQENKILFDYKLRDGRCTTTNARYLLRMAGILQ